MGMSMYSRVAVAVARIRKRRCPDIRTHFPLHCKYHNLENVTWSVCCCGRSYMRDQWVEKRGDERTVEEMR